MTTHHAIPADPRLSVFDLVTIGAGSDAGAEIRGRVQLAQSLEERGFRGYWFGEHHLGRGRAGASPLALVALTAAQTRLEVGASVAVLPHYRPLGLVEGFGTVAAAFPGRIHVGLGRGADYSTLEVSEQVLDASRKLADRADADVPRLELGEFHALLGQLLQSSPADPAGYERSVREVLSLLRRPIATIEDVPLEASPGRRTDLTPWLFGFGGVRSAEFAAENGLPYAVNHHVGAAAYRDAVAAYREGFRPVGQLRAPRVAVSVHALVAPSRREAQELGRAYPAWFSHVVRRGFSAPVPPPGAPTLDLTEAGKKTLDATLAIRIVGEPHEVAQRIREVAAGVGADDVLVNTVTHDLRSYRQSFELLAEAWHAVATATQPHDSRPLETPSVAIPQ